MTLHYCKTALTLLASAAIGVSTLTAPAFAEWTGGDGQPTNPLPCEGDAPAPAAMDYNGASPKNSPDRAGQPMRVVDIPKLIGVGYLTPPRRVRPRLPPSWAISRSRPMAPRRRISTIRSH